MMNIDTTYFRYNSIIYKQTFGMAMDFTFTLRLATLFVEAFEKDALATVPPPHPHHVLG